MALYMLLLNNFPGTFIQQMHIILHEKLPESKSETGVQVTKKANVVFSEFKYTSKFLSLPRKMLKGKLFSTLAFKWYHSLRKELLRHLLEVNKNNLDIF